MPTADNVLITKTEIYGWPVGTRDFVQHSIPVDGVTRFQRRASSVRYKRVVHTYGKYSRGILRHPDAAGITYATGIAAPPAPTVALGAAGVLTGNKIYYVEARHKIGSTIIHQSNLSSGSSIITPANQQVTVTLPQASDIPPPDDLRVTHLGIYRSDDGGLPRFHSEVALGTVSISDNTPTGSLGETPPLTANGLSVANRRGVPPYARWAEKFHNRLWLAGDTDNPERIWYSEINEFESFGEDSFIETRDGEPVSGLKKVGDELLPFCFVCTYEITGYRLADFVIRKVHNSIGCISHFSIVNYNDNRREKLLWASQRGVIQYDGGFKFVMEDMERFWKVEYEQFPEAYENATATEDWEEHWYKLLMNIPRDVVAGYTLDSAGVRVPQTVRVESFYYIGHYLRWHPSFIGGDPQMMWSRKIRARRDTVIGYLADDSGRRVNYVMGCDGFIRRENVPEDGDDDGDAWQKRFRVKSGHNYPKTPGGDDQDGSTLDSFWLHLQAEENEVLLRIWAGEDQAAEEDAEGVEPKPVYEQTFAPGADVGPVSGDELVPSVRRFTGVQQAGPGYTWETTVLSPIGVRLSGWGAVYGVGTDHRGEKLHET